MALAELQKIRPSLVQDVIDEYCQARRTYLTRAFLDALTVGGPGGTPRPIGNFQFHVKNNLFSPYEFFGPFLI